MPLSVAEQYRRLASIALVSGTVAGAVLFGIQRVTIIPLIEAAETYESNAASGVVHGDEPRPLAHRADRSIVTALVTVLTGIAFGAILLGAASLAESRLGARVGALWGLAGFACFVLAPALGLPPLPPGAAAAEVSVRQIWWAGTVAATAIGLWLIVGRRDRTWVLRTAGLICIAAPHIVGAPAARGVGVIPPTLVREFAVRSVAGSGVFWLLLGAIGGFLSAITMKEGRHGQHFDHARR